MSLPASLPSASRRHAIDCPQTSPSFPIPTRVRLIAVAGLLIGTCFAARCLAVARHDSITSDESTHLQHTLGYWCTGDDGAMWALGTPRLPHLLASWPSFWVLRGAGLLPTSGGVSPGALSALVLSGEPRVLVPARVVAIAWGCALLAIVGWGVGRRRGAITGLVAAGLLSLVPEVLAHSAIAGSDLPFTTTAMLAVVLLSRYAERPSIGRWLAVAVAVGAAWATRHTGLLLVPLAGLVAELVAVRQAWWAGFGGVTRALVRAAGSVLLLIVIAGGVLWAGDGFGVVTPAELAARSEHMSIPQRIGPLEVAHWPVPTSLVSLAIQARHQGQGHQAYFLGERREHGWPLYFPVAFGLKTPIGLMGLLILAAARFRPRDAWEWICLGLLGILWLSLIRSHVNIGVRYALLTFPLTAPFVARLFEPTALRDRVWGPATLVLGLLLVGSSLGAHPRYLSWFNEIGGGPARGWLYLADSNLDWGQDLDGVGAACARLGIDEVTTDISSERRLRVPGVAAHTNPSREDHVVNDPTAPARRRIPDAHGDFITFPTRYAAVSASRLMGLYSQHDLDWLRTRRVIERVGDSVWLFDLDRPADRPLGP